MILLVATQSEVLAVDAVAGTMTAGRGLEMHHPTCLAADRFRPGRAWCGTERGGIVRTEDGGASWQIAGLENQRIMAIAASAARQDLVWAGTEPSDVWRSEDGGTTWTRTQPLADLPSSPTWAFPPRPDTHHVRWIACHPALPDRLWVAIEAGALVSTHDGGEHWLDRVSGGPYDTHELAVHADAPHTLRVAAGDGYYESFDGGESWISPMRGFDVGYLRSVAIDPGDLDIVIVSASSHPRSAYVARHADGRIFRRTSDGDWQRVTHGWPDPPNTIAPLLVAGTAPGSLWAADERGIHHSDDGGPHWHTAAAFRSTPNNLRGLAVIQSG